MTSRYCSEKCAEPVPCPTCGRNLPPAGRSAPLAMPLPSCCATARNLSLNTRHIWNVSELDD